MTAITKKSIPLFVFAVIIFFAATIALRNNSTIGVIVCIIVGILFIYAGLNYDKMRLRKEKKA